MVHTPKRSPNNTIESVGGANSYFKIRNTSLRQLKAISQRAAPPGPVATDPIASLILLLRDALWWEMFARHDMNRGKPMQTDPDSERRTTLLGSQVGERMVRACIRPSVSAMQLDTNG